MTPDEFARHLAREDADIREGMRADHRATETIPDNFWRSPTFQQLPQRKQGELLRPGLLAHRIEGGHWLTFNDERHITGCHCGFLADPDDMGYGDSVLDHFEQAVRAEERNRKAES